MPVVDIAEVAADIMTRRQVDRVRIVGIDGAGGSGKSTLARKLLDHLPDAKLVEIDDFVSWPDFARSWPRFDEQVLQPLLAGHDAHYQVRDWRNDEFGTSLADWKTVPWSQVLVLEGVTCTRRAARPHLAYSIWVETPGDRRLERGIARDGTDHHDLWQSWMWQERAFFAEDETRQRADLRIDGAPMVAHDPDTQIVTL